MTKKKLLSVLREHGGLREGDILEQSFGALFIQPELVEEPEKPSNVIPIRGRKETA